LSSSEILPQSFSTRNFRLAAGEVGPLRTCALRARWAIGSYGRIVNGASSRRIPGVASRSTNGLTLLPGRDAGRP